MLKNVTGPRVDEFVTSGNHYVSTITTIDATTTTTTHTPNPFDFRELKQAIRLGPPNLPPSPPSIVLHPEDRLDRAFCSAVGKAFTRVPALFERNVSGSRFSASKELSRFPLLLCYLRGPSYTTSSTLWWRVRLGGCWRKVRKMEEKIIQHLLNNHMISCLQRLFRVSLYNKLLF